MPYLFSPALKIFLKALLRCLIVITAVQNRTHLYPVLPRPPVSETKTWDFTCAQLHSKTSTAGCSLPRGVRMARDSYAVLSPWAQVLSCICIYMQTMFKKTQKQTKQQQKNHPKNKQTNKPNQKFIGTIGPRPVWENYTRGFTLPCFLQPKWGWIQTTLLCSDLTLFWGLNWRCHKWVHLEVTELHRSFTSLPEVMLFFSALFKVLDKSECMWRPTIHYWNI